MHVSPMPEYDGDNSGKACENPNYGGVYYLVGVLLLATPKDGGRLGDQKSAGESKKQILELKNSVGENKQMLV